MAEAAKKPTKSERMYKDSPRLERDDASGKTAVKKGASEKDASPPAPDAGEKDEMGDAGLPIPVRHAHDHMEMAHRHAHEVLALHHKHRGELNHAHHAGGDIAPIDERHQAEHKEMHKRHHAELAAMHKRHEGEMGGGEKKE